MPQSVLSQSNLLTFVVAVRRKELCSQEDFAETSQYVANFTESQEKTKTPQLSSVSVSLLYLLELVPLLCTIKLPPENIH